MGDKRIKGGMRTYLGKSTSAKEDVLPSVIRDYSCHMNLNLLTNALGGGGHVTSNLHSNTEIYAAEANTI